MKRLTTAFITIFLLTAATIAQPMPGSLQQLWEETKDKDVTPNPRTLIIYRPQNNGAINDVRCFLRLEDENGNDICKKLRSKAETRNIPIIMVTAKTSEIDLVRGIEDGADDYIKKPFSVMELISRVKALLRRTLTEEVKEIKLDELAINNEKHEVSIDGQIIELTYKEYELLSLFILNKGLVLTRDTIMDQVWGTDYEGESRTIDMHVKTLRQKLGEYGARIKTIRNVGYVIE